MSVQWSRLRSLDVALLPADSPLPPAGGRRAPFRASFTTTVNDLARELRALDATAIVLELDIEDRDLRLDGYLRADARLKSDSIRISFTSKWGPLRYETGEYRAWQDNLRAIALSMEALRAVDRYGVSKRGEQYRGWRALPMATGGDPRDAVVTAEQARAVIAEAAGLALDSLNDGGLGEAIRRAVRTTHPDRGGDPERFILVQRAKEILTA